jgi:hypothetical protein
VATDARLNIAALRLHNAQQPSCRVPDEVLAPIFELASATPHATNMKLALSQVSRVWRAVALDHKRLWTSVELSRPRLAVDFVARSRPALFVLRLHKRRPGFASRTGPEELVEAFRCAIQDASRIKEIVLRTRDCEDLIEDHLLPVLQDIKPVFSRLERLILDNRWTPDWASEQTSEPFEPAEDALDVNGFFQHSLPAVQTLTLDGCYVSPTSLLHCTPTHVDLGCMDLSCADLLLFLRHAAPCMETLRFAAELQMADELARQKPQRLALPRIQFLTITGHLAASAVLLGVFAVPHSAYVKLFAEADVGHDADLALTALADFVNGHYLYDGATQYSLSLGPHSLRVASMGGPAGSFVEVAGTALSPAAHRVFCFRLDPALRSRVALLRIRDAAHDAADWMALGAFAGVRAVHVAGRAAASFVQALAAAPGAGMPFFPRLAVLHVLGAPLARAGQVVSAQHVQDMLGPVLQGQATLHPLSVSHARALMETLRSTASCSTARWFLPAANASEQWVCIDSEPVPDVVYG